ncbi:putative RNA cytidine acetyltransferase [Paratrimastix pyriformis]|uniref:RNA cytidine acetyltransferase n=1 Tax=Paratrimastix pyriformis TaxID=342808 RepID=A0ABQ8UV75_9EUKA|nr:putative RNA cytidine acetyltransferase [Paratrimastix pyriformis]
MGYGQRALDLLTAFYEGRLFDEQAATAAAGALAASPATMGGAAGDIHTEAIAPRAALPPLLAPLRTVRPAKLHYLGTSFGLTLELFNFWKRAGLKPIYLRQTPNELTGDHSCIMVRQLAPQEDAAEPPSPWLDAFCEDFTRRMTALLGYEFRQYAPPLGLALLDPTQRLIRNGGAAAAETAHALTKAELDVFMTSYDLKRLESYSRGQLDYHVVVDLLPLVARLYFTLRLPVALSPLQATLMVALGLQHKTVTQLEKELGLPSNQILALFGKALKKVAGHLNTIVEQVIATQIEAEQAAAPTPALPEGAAPAGRTLDEDLAAAAKEAQRALTRKQQALLKDPALQKFAIKGSDKAWESALKLSRDKIPASLSVATGAAKKHARGKVLGEDELPAEEPAVPTPARAQPQPQDEAPAAPAQEQTGKPQRKAAPQQPAGKKKPRKEAA